MGVLIDTDVFVDIERGRPVSDITDRIGDERRGLSVITVSELLHGVQRATGAVRARRTAFVEGLLAELEALPITVGVARVHSELSAQMATSGERIGAHDLWIGATAVAYGFGVVTGNVRDFRRIPGLRVIDLKS